MSTHSMCMSVHSQPEDSGLREQIKDEKVLSTWVLIHTREAQSTARLGGQPPLCPKRLSTTRARAKGSSAGLAKTTQKPPSHS